MPVSNDVDLNLLRVVAELLHDGHLTRAARRLKMSQPALSHALARARIALGDPLFVRGPRGLVPTPRALALREPLSRGLDELNRAVRGPEPFDPTTADRTFVVATADFGSLSVVEPVVRRCRVEAPHLRFDIVHVGLDVGRLMAEGQVDLALAPVQPPIEGGGLRRSRVFDERFVCLLDPSHPALPEWDLDAYCAHPHAQITPRGTPGGPLDDALARLGRTRRVTLRVANFLAAPRYLLGTDLILTLPERVAQAVAPGLGLAVMPLPLPLGGFTLSMIWHERADADPGHRYLRALVQQSGLGSPGVP